GQLDALAHALGVAAKPACRAIRHSHAKQSLLGPGAGFRTTIAAKSSHRLDKMPSGHLFVECVNFGTVSGIKSRLRLPGVHTQDFDSSHVRPELACRKTQER